MTRIAGLLFDKDGTLFDFKTTWGGWTRRVVTLLADGSQERAQALALRLGYDLDSGDFAPGSAVIAHTSAEIRDLLLPLLPGAGADALLDQMNRMAGETDVVEAVPLVPLFRRFSDMGLKLGLATNDAEVPARAHLDRAAIAGHFDFVAGFDSGWGGKPDTGQMHAFLDATGLAPHEVAMVGDSLHDLEAGRAAGMRAVGVLTGIADRAALVAHADVVLDNIGQLPGWIASQS